MTPADRARIEDQRRLAALTSAGIDPGRAREVVAETRLQERLTAEYTRQRDLLNEMGSIIGGDLQNAIQGLIQGTTSWRDVLADTLGQLGSVFLRAGLNGLAGGDGRGFFSFLAGGLGARAEGGPVGAGKPYMVGEKGRELFIPGVSGVVVPNDQVEDAMAVMGGDEGGGETLTSKELVERSMQRMASSERTSTQEKLLSAAAGEGGGGGSVTVEWTQVGDMQVVTREQLIAAMRQTEKAAARRGQALTANAMRNDPAFRSKMR